MRFYFLTVWLGFGLPVLLTESVRRLSLGVPVVDDVFPGFEGGDFGVLYGNGVSFLSFVLCVRGVLPRSMGGLGSSVVFVDGGNSFNPYLISEVARGYGFDPREVLGRVCFKRIISTFIIVIVMVICCKDTLIFSF